MNGEYWLSFHDRWLWVVEEGVAKHLIHIPAEHVFDIKAHSGYVAVRCESGFLVLDMARNLEVM